MLHTKMVKKEVLWKCSAGLMLTLKLSAQLLVKWAGWELKFSQLKNQFFHMNGLKMVNLIHGGSITSQCHIISAEDMEIVKLSEV